MYIVVVYDADPIERENIRAVLMPRLHWIQASVFAGELTKVAAEDLYRSLEQSVKNARVAFWLFDRPPDVRQIGAQEDRESVFL
jgi:CRISPR/Cas system-associated endoribonuclease Cas2